MHAYVQGGNMPLNLHSEILTPHSPPTEFLGHANFIFGLSTRIRVIHGGRHQIN